MYIFIYKYKFRSANLWYQMIRSFRKYREQREANMKVVKRTADGLALQTATDICYQNRPQMQDIKTTTTALRIQHRWALCYHLGQLL